MGAIFHRVRPWFSGRLPAVGENDSEKAYFAVLFHRGSDGMLEIVNPETMNSRQVPCEALAEIGEQVLSVLFESKSDGVRFSKTLGGHATEMGDTSGDAVASVLVPFAMSFVEKFTKRAKKEVSIVRDRLANEEKLKQTLMQSRENSLRRRDRLLGSKHAKRGVLRASPSSDEGDPE